MSTAEDELLDPTETGAGVEEESSSMFNYTLILKVLAVLAVIYLIYTFYKTESSGTEYAPASLPLSTTAGSTFDAVSTAFGS